MNFLLFTFTLIILYLASYLEWRCIKEEGTRPSIDVIFSICGRLAFIIWAILGLQGIHVFSWYVAILSILMSIFIPAFFSRKIISRDKAPVIVIFSFFIGLCIFMFQVRF